MSSDQTMDPKTGPAIRPILRLRALLGALGLVVAVAIAMPGAASAVNLFTLDNNPAAGAVAAVVVDSVGTGYFAWEHNGGSGPNAAMFCKVPRGAGACASPLTLPTAPVGFGGVTAVDAAYPVLGSGQTVYVVGPRFIAQDVVVWTSTDGGVTFGQVTATTQSGTSEGSNPTDVLAAPAGGFYISSHNPGLAFTNVPASGTGVAPVTDLAPGAFASDSTLGLAGGGTTGNPVEAFGNLNNGQPNTINFRSYSGTGSLNNQASWTAASQVSAGITPSLAGGPSGLFLASEDTDAAGNYTQVNVRKYTGSAFGTPIATLQTDTSNDNGGRVFQTPGGRLGVAWVGQPLADHGVPIRLYESSTGGAPFTQVGNVAEGAPADAIHLIRAAAADDGQGFVSFHEIGSGLLRVADFTPIKATTATVTALTAAGQAAATNITVGPGTQVTDVAAIQTAGATATGATGTVAYSVYSDASCRTLVRTAGTVAVGGGTAASLPISLPVGTWYYVATYSGDGADLPSTSACGAEVLTVAPTAVGVSGIIFVGGNIVITASFNTSGNLLVSSQVVNASVLTHAVLASAAKKGRCKSGQALLKVGKKKKCVSNSFGTSTKAIPAAGSYQIKVAPNAAARKALKKGRTLHVKVTLTFKPSAGGASVVTARNITIKGKKHK